MPQGIAFFFQKHRIAICSFSEEKTVAKIMLVRCSSNVVKFVQSKRRFHVIVADNEEKAVEVLEQTSPDLVPDLTLIGNYPPLELNKRQTMKAMTEQAERLKKRFRRARFVLVNGRIVSRRSTESVAGVCNGSPQAVFETILKILSPGN